MIGVSRAPANKRITKQCIMCCGFVVPPSGPTAGKPRRSARIRDKKFGRQDSYRHEMLGGSKTKTNFDLNKHGFEIRGRGGWV